MTDVKGALHIDHTEPVGHSNSPGVTKLFDDEFTAVWMDPDGAIAKRLTKDPEEAKALFLEAKRAAGARRSTRRK